MKKDDETAGVELRDIPGYEGLYAASRDGRIYSYPRTIMRKYSGLTKCGGKWLKGADYKMRCVIRVRLCKDDVQEQFSVHRIVAELYLHNPLNKRYVLHLDGNYRNNHVNNLKYSDHPVAFTPHRKTRSVSQYTKDSVFIKEYESITEAAKDTSFCYESISRAAKSKVIYKGFIWKYCDEDKK